jgi:hypothetical protein
LMFLTFPEIQADFKTNFCAKFKLTQSTQKHVKRRLRRLRRRAQHMFQ